MNRKFALTILLFCVGIAAALIYRRYDNEYSPLKTRSFYLENNDPVRFTKRLSDTDQKQFEEVRVEEPKENPRLEKVFTKLEAIKSSCDAVYKKNLEQDKIIDPDSEIFSDTKQVASLVMKIYENIILNREKLKDIVPEYLVIIQDEEKVSVDKFYNFIQMMMSCFSSDMSFFVETTFEVDRSDEDKKFFEKEVLGSLMKVVYWIVSEDRLPDALLFSLNIFRAVGEYFEYGEDYFSEVDNLYEKITNYEEVFFSEFEDVKFVSEPGLRMESYLREMEIISDDFKFFFDQRFPEYR